MQLGYIDLAQLLFLAQIDPIEFDWNGPKIKLGQINVTQLHSFGPKFILRMQFNLFGSKMIIEPFKMISLVNVRNKIFLF